MELSNPPRTRSNEAFFVSNFWIFLVGCDRVRLWHLVTTSEGFAVGVVMGNMPINKYLFHYLLTCLFIWKPEESSTLSANDRQVEQTRNTRETSSQKEYLLRKTETHHSLQQLPWGRTSKSTGRPRGRCGAPEAAPVAQRQLPRAEKGRGAGLTLWQEERFASAWEVDQLPWDEETEKLAPQTDNQWICFTDFDISGFLWLFVRLYIVWGLPCWLRR